MTEFNRRRSRSFSRRRNHSRGRDRSDSIKRNRDSSIKRRRLDKEESGSFHAPYRCLIPRECVSALIGKGGLVLRHLSVDTRSEVNIVKDLDTPNGLSDRIICINGTSRSKREALSLVLSQIRKQLDFPERDEMPFNILVPEQTAAILIGTRGATISAMKDRSGTHMEVSRENVTGTGDRALTIRGSVDCTVKAVEEVSSILQSLANRGKLQKSDFPFCASFPRYVEDEAKSPSDVPQLKRDTTGALVNPDNEGSRREATRKWIEVPSDFDSGLRACISITQREGDWLTHPDTIDTVKSIESKYKVYVHLSEPPCPPLSMENEMLEISGHSLEDKQNALEDILQMLGSSRVCGFLVPREQIPFVVGQKRAGLSAIAERSNATISLQPDSIENQSMTLLNISGNLPAVIGAARQVMGAIDAAAYKESQKSTKTSTQSNKTLTLQLASSELDLVEHDLSKLRKLCPKLQFTFGSECLTLTGDPKDILQIVSNVLAIPQHR
jgi:transcription antitermination factor NusA-like protein